MSGSGGDASHPSGSGGGRSRIWVAAVAVLLLVFVAGGAAGSAVRDHLRREAPTSGVRRAPGGRGGANDSRGIRRNPLDRLDLSTAERARVDSVVSRRRAQIEAFWAGPGQQLRSIMDSMHAEMRAQMTPEHRAAFDSLPDPRRRGGRGGPEGGASPR